MGGSSADGGGGPRGSRSSARSGSWPVGPSTPRLWNSRHTCRRWGIPSASGRSFLLIVVLIVVAMASLLLRLRRSRGEERQQLKWFAYAASVSVGLLILAIPAITLSPTLSNAMFTGAFSLGFAFLVPAAAALAILRHGLYEIDVVIKDRK